MHRDTGLDPGRRQRGSPRARRQRRWRICVLLSCGLIVAGCGRAVTVSPPAASPEAGLACAALQDQLPERLAGQPRLAVTPDEGTTAAWGTPAIVWRCGVGEPPGLEPTSQLLTVDGVDWFPEELTDGVRFTTVGLSPVAELTVPQEYPSAASLLTQLPTGRAAGHADR